MTIEGGMRIGRWLLVCAALAVAGGVPAIRGGYAEVAAAQVVAVPRTARPVVAMAPSRARTTEVAVAAPVARPLAATVPLWLAHSSLLL